MAASAPLAGEDIYDTFRRLTRFNEQNSGAFLVDTLEVKANTVSKIENTVDAMPGGIKAFFEIGLGQNFAELIATLAIDRQHAKIRTGGVRPDEFPGSRDIIRFIRTCLAGNVPFKATAGLHHPIRCYRPLTYAEGGPSGTMHGFLNLFLMTGYARESYKPDTLEELMEEEFGEVFHFDELGVTWRGENFLSNWQLERLRRKRHPELRLMLIRRAGRRAEGAWPAVDAGRRRNREVRNQKPEVYYFRR